MRVERDGRLLAESSEPTLVFETNLPVRFYLPRSHLHAEAHPSTRRTRCAYKGEASYLSFELGIGARADLAWTYEDRSRTRPRLRDSSRSSTSSWTWSSTASAASGPRHSSGAGSSRKPASRARVAASGNEQPVRAFADAIDRGDIEAAISLCHPEVDFLSMLDVSGRRHYGHEGIRGYFGDVASAWAEWRVEVHRVVAAADGRVAIVMTMHVRGLESGAVLWSGPVTSGR